MIVQWSLRAQSELRLILEYLSTEASEAVAKSVGKRILLAADRLEGFQQSGRPTRVKDEREFIVAPYILRYRIKHKKVVILFVRHGARQPLP